MLQPVAPGPSVVVCSTCRVSAETRDDADGRRGGALLEDALRAVQATAPELQGVAVQAMPCLFACTRHCAVHIRAPGKVGYVLGDFAPDEDAARAILEYAARHAASAEGQVPYREWPQGVKGHFITRTPPEGFLFT
jgi:predicted metal-binding protein